MKNNINDLREYKVVKSNILIQQSRFKLSAQKLKIIYFIISQIKPTDTDLLDQNFNISDFCKVCGVDSTNGANYKYIKDSLKELRDHSIWIKNEDGSETTFSWISKVTIRKNSGTVTIRLDSDLKPHLLQLKEKFSQFDLIYTLAMKSQYSIRLYDLLKSYEWKKTQAFDIEQLKTQLDAEKYKNFKDFRVKVIEIALREISSFSDLDVSYELKKTGRKYSHITFKIKLKKGIDAVLETHDNIYSIIDPQLCLFDDILKKK